NAMYSVISPEGCAAILWRDAEQAPKAAAAFKPDAAHCLELGVIDGIVPEPVGGAQEDPDLAAQLLGEAVEGALAELDRILPDARRLHYDFRFGRGGALASWAVPKGIPLTRGERHLAVHVEDHPLEYATFEGTIPAGEYGAGTVEIWDTGTYELLEEKKNGGLTVHLHGSRLEGVWTLVP